MKSKDSLLNAQEIVFASEEQVICVDDGSPAWGQQVLQALEVGRMGDFAKAHKICGYLHDHFAYNFQRRIRYPEIIQKQGGNYLSHTLMGIFLLRLEGIHAKFAHEVHLTKQYRYKMASTIIHPESMMELQHKDEWQEFVNLFSNWRQADFHKEYLPAPLLRRIKAMSIQWFKWGG